MYMIMFYLASKEQGARRFSKKSLSAEGKSGRVGHDRLSDFIGLRRKVMAGEIKQTVLLIR